MQNVAFSIDKTLFFCYSSAFILPVENDLLMQFARVARTAPGDRLPRRLAGIGCATAHCCTREGARPEGNMSEATQEPDRTDETNLIKTEDLVETPEYEKKKHETPFHIRVLHHRFGSLKGKDLVMRMGIEEAMANLDEKKGLEALYLVRRLSRAPGAKKGDKDNTLFDKCLKAVLERRGKNSAAVRTLVNRAGTLNVPAFIVQDNGKLEAPKQATARVIKTVETDEIMRESATLVKEELEKVGAHRLLWVVEEESAAISGPYRDRKARVRELFGKKGAECTDAERNLRDIAQALVQCANIWQLVEIIYWYSPEFQDGDRKGDKDDRSAYRVLETELARRAAGGGEGAVQYKDLLDTAARLSTTKKVVRPMVIDIETGKVEAKHEAAARLVQKAGVHPDAIIKASAAAMEKRFRDNGLLKAEAEEEGGE